MMPVKVCKECGLEKELEHFYNSNNKDGKRGKCILCFKKQNNKWNKLNKYWLKVRDWEKNNRERYLKNHLIASKKHEIKYPLEIAARRKAISAVYSGILKREVCIKCGDTKVQAHHEDYNKPLDVVWLCSKHHHELHKLLTIKICK